MIDKGQWREFGQDTGVTPLLFTRSAMGFLMTTESQDLGLTSHPKDGFLFDSHYIGVLGPTQTAGWASPAGLTNTSSISNLVFTGGLPSRYWPGSTLLSFSGQPVLVCRVTWLWPNSTTTNNNNIFLSINTQSTKYFMWVVIVAAVNIV